VFIFTNPIKNKAITIVIFMLLIFNSSKIIASYPNNFNLKRGHVVVQLGGYYSTQDKTQHVDIEDLIGDDFTVSDNHRVNGLIGLGYFLDGQDKKKFKMSYGVNFFYLPNVSVSGDVIQENLFANLSYGYGITHYPLYAIAKSTMDLNAERYALTVDGGAGFNFMNTSGFHEASIDSHVTMPDHIFSGKTTTTFSATAGVGIKFNNVFGRAPLECGYRFFYLGQGNFNVLANQVITILNTGPVYANAVICSIIV